MTPLPLPSSEATPIAPISRLAICSGRFATIACAAIALFSFYEVDGKPAGLALWALFGTTNQLLAGLTLTLITLYLRNLGRPSWPTALPAVFMMASTLSAMAINLKTFAPGGAKEDSLLLLVGGILFLLGVWLLFDAAIALVPSNSKSPST